MSCTVIIAESSPAIAKTIAQAFQDKGYHIEGIFSDGIRAMRAAKAARPSVITLDLILPRLSGLQLARASAKLSDPPIIIAISAITEPVRLAQAKDAGVSYYLVKPLSEDKLRQIIQEVSSGQLVAQAGAVAG